MGIEFTKTISENEVRSNYINLTDDERTSYGKLFPTSVKRVVIIDEHGRTFNATRKPNQLWGSVSRWFKKNSIEAGVIVRIYWNEMNYVDDLPAVYLTVVEEREESHPDGMIAVINSENFEAHNQDHRVSPETLMKPQPVPTVLNSHGIQVGGRIVSAETKDSPSKPDRGDGTPIELFNLSTHARNCLLRAGILTIEELSILQDHFLLQIRGLGEETLRDIRHSLSAYRNTGNSQRFSKIYFSRHITFLPWWDDSSISVLDLTPRTRAALLKEGFQTIGDLLSVDLQDESSSTLALDVVQDEIAQKLGNYLLDFSKNSKDQHEILLQPISVLALAPTVISYLEKTGIQNIGDLVRMTPKQVSDVSKVFSNSFQNIKQRLSLHLSERINQNELKDEHPKQPHSTDDKLSDTIIEPQPIPEIFVAWWDTTPIDALRVSEKTKKYLIEAGLNTVSNLGTILLGSDISKRPQLLEAILNYSRIYEKEKFRSIFENESLISILDLSRRSYNALIRAGIKTVGSVASLSRDELLAAPNFGTKSLEEVRKKLKKFVSSSGSRDEPQEAKDEDVSTIAITNKTTFEEIFVHYAERLNDRELQVVTWRYGINSPQLTLNEIGEKLSITRERVRQIERKALRRLRYPTNHARYLSNLTWKILIQAGGVISEKQIEYFLQAQIEIGSADPIGIMRLLFDVFGHEWISKSRAWVVDDLIQVVGTIQESLLKILEKQYTPITIDKLVQMYRQRKKRRKHTFDYTNTVIRACIREHPLFFIDELGNVGLEKWNRQKLDEMILALREISEPVHYSVIAAKTNELLPADQRTTTRNIHAHLSRLPDIFVRVGKGVFGLAEWDLHDDGNLANAAYRVLKDAGRHMRLKNLTEDVLKTWKVKPSSVQAAIENDARFVKMQPGIYILQEHIHDTSIDQTSIDYLESRDGDKIPSREQEDSFHEKKGIGSDILLDALRDIGFETTSVQESESEVVIGPIRFDPMKKILRSRGKKIHLDTKTSRLFQMFIGSKGKTITHNQIMKSIWRRGFSGTPEVVDFHVNFLREAIEFDPKNPQIIQTVQGKGYRFIAE